MKYKKSLPLSNRWSGDSGYSAERPGQRTQRSQGASADHTQRSSCGDRGNRSWNRPRRLDMVSGEMGGGASLPRSERVRSMGHNRPDTAKRLATHPCSNSIPAASDAMDLRRSRRDGCDDYALCDLRLAAGRWYLLTPPRNSELLLTHSSEQRLSMWRCVIRRRYCTAADCLSHNRA